MTVGYQNSSAQINSQLGGLAVDMRDLCRRVTNYQKYINALGLSGLEATGYSAADAQAAITMMSYLNTPAAIFFGQATQPDEFDFSNATAPITGGQ